MLRYSKRFKIRPLFFKIIHSTIFHLFNFHFPQTGVPSLDDEGDECSFVEDEDEEEAEVPAEAANEEKPGCIARLCCCCCSPKGGEKEKTNQLVILDPENGNVAPIKPVKEKKVNCCGKFLEMWFWFRSHMKSFIYSVWFENSIMLCIIVNTLCLALDYPDVDVGLSSIMEKINGVSIQPFIITLQCNLNMN